MRLKLFKYSSDIAKEWDAFVKNNPKGSIHQISAWKNLQESIKGRELVLGFGVRDSDTNEITATCFCTKMEVGQLNKFWFYSARGPVFDPLKNAEAGNFLIESIKKELLRTEALFWRIDPYLNETEYKTIKLETKSATQNYQPENTLLLALTKTQEQLLSEMKRKGRYNINLARKKGVTVRTLEAKDITTKDLDIFWKLNNQTTTRDAFSGHEKDYYKNFCQKLAPHAKLFIAFSEDGSPIATAINTYCGEKAIYYFGASTSDPKYRNLMAPYLLQWEMICDAQKNGFTSYDFLGIAPEGDLKHPYAGITEFKIKFGGQRYKTAPGREISLKPFWHFLYKMAKHLR